MIRMHELLECIIPMGDDDDDDVSAGEEMLRLLCSFDYTASGSATDIASPMVFKVIVYSMADLYDVSALEPLPPRFSRDL